MNDLDRKIKQALNDVTEDISLSDSQSLIKDLAETFTGKYKIVMLLVWVKFLAIATLFFISIYQFFQQESIMAMIAYATLAVMCITAVSCIYLIFWISINKHQLNKDIKRLELQVALLLIKLESQTR